MVRSLKAVLQAVFIFALSSSNFAFSMVDMKTLNYSDDWTDLSIESIPIKISRFYNSRSRFDGMFGYGWCSVYETSLEIVSPSELRYIFCGGGQWFTLRREEAAVEVKNVPSTDPTFVSHRFLGGSVTALTARWTGSHYVVTDDGFSNRSGEYWFDTSGNLVMIIDGSGIKHYLLYENDVLTGVVINDAYTVRFTYGPNEKVSKVLIDDPTVSVHEGTTESNTKNPSDDTPRSVQYAYDEQGNLRSVRNAWGNTYRYSSDDRHRLTRIDFPDGTYKGLTYEENRDLVVAFRNRIGCTEKYLPQVGHRFHRVWVEKRCDGKITNQSLYEFTFFEELGEAVQPSRIRVWNDGEMFIKEYNEDGTLKSVVPGSDALPLHPDQEWKALFWPPKSKTLQ